MLFHTNMWYMMVYWYIMLYSSKVSFPIWLTNSQTFQLKVLLLKKKKKKNFLTKQEPEGSYVVDFHDFFKRIATETIR